MPSIFTRIVEGEIPAHKVYEDDRYLAFLDIGPVAVGHTLVIPKEEVDHLFDLDADTHDGLFRVVRVVAQAVRQALSPPRVGVVVAGFEVPHAHVHVIPLEHIGQTNIEASNRIEQTQEQLAATAERLRAAIAATT
jgi:histidine triad (HIT) family protein